MAYQVGEREVLISSVLLGEQCCCLLTVVDFVGSNYPKTVEH